jgi:putative N6-adenine-specific DNA methylase
MIAANIAPGVNRTFTAETWKHLVAPSIWKDSRDEALDLETPNIETDLQGYDIDPDAIAAARANAKLAGVDHLIHFQTRPVAKLSHPRKYGFIVTNPPYGERLTGAEEDSIRKLYKELGDAYKRLDTWSMYLITSFNGCEEALGVKAAKNRKIYNGMLKTYFYMFPGPKPPRKSPH